MPIEAFSLALDFVKAMQYVSKQGQCSGCGSKYVLTSASEVAEYTESTLMKSDLSPPITQDNGAPRLAAWLANRNDLTARFVAAGRAPGLINLAGGLPEAALFPVESLAAIAKQSILDFPKDCLGYIPTEGLPELRDAIARRYSTPAMRLHRDNVLLTSSGSQSLDLIGKVLVEPGANVGALFPSYVGAMDAWRPRSPVYRDLGCALESSAENLLKAFAGLQFAYTIPNFSNPTGKLVDEAGRRALVSAAHQTGVWLVEDDPYCSLQYDGHPVPSLLEISAGEANSGETYTGPVIHLGSVSKELTPGLRVGWVIAAPEMVRALTAAKQGTDLCSSGLNQRIVLAAIEGGLVDEMAPKMVSLYRDRRDALCAAMAQYLTEWFEWEVPVGGMFVWVRAKSPSFDADRLVDLGTASGVLVGPGSVFDPWGRTRGCLRINFTANPSDKLVEGVRRLAQILRQLSIQ